MTYHQVAGTQEQNHTENVDHAGGENSIPGAEEHGLPHEQFDPPPRSAGVLQALQKETTNPALGCFKVIYFSRPQVLHILHLVEKQWQHKDKQHSLNI